MSERFIVVSNKRSPGTSKPTWEVRVLDEDTVAYGEVVAKCASGTWAAAIARALNTEEPS